MTVPASEMELEYTKGSVSFDILVLSLACDIIILHVYTCIIMPFWPQTVR